MFYDNAAGRKIYVPAGSVEAYDSAEYWYEYKDYIFAEQQSLGIVAKKVQREYHKGTRATFLQGGMGCDVSITFSCLHIVNMLLHIYQKFSTKK